MKLDLDLLKLGLSQAPQDETVSTEGVNSYLIEHIIRPVLRGETVKYGDIDYDEFEDDDLRAACGYCEALSQTSYKLGQIHHDIDRLQPCASKMRAFC